MTMPVTRVSEKAKLLLRHLTERDGRTEGALIDEALVLYATKYKEARPPIPSKAGRPKLKK
jgi:hypothetical protein